MARVVVTGMGVLAPNGHGLPAFEQALREGISGVRFIEELAEHRFACQVGGIPPNVDSLRHDYFQDEALLRMNASMVLGVMAAFDCWRDGGFVIPEPGDDSVDWDTGAVIGSGLGGVDTLAARVIPEIDSGRVRRLGSTMTEQIMNSAVSACVSGFLGLGGPVTSNSSACITGTEAIIMAHNLVRSGRVKRVLAGGVEGYSRYAWGIFDAMRVLARGFNDRPSEASRPMSATAAGFVPASGSGVLLVESLESALSRDATIHGEILGGYLNSGGQRSGGSITAPNEEGVRRCIHGALEDAGITADDVEVINGHLTGTMADGLEIRSWQAALGRSPEQMPWIQATKSLVGHALGGAGAIECVASIIQLSRSFLHGSANCEDLSTTLIPFAGRICQGTRPSDARILAKASFGFGDINGCILFKKWEAENRMVRSAEFHERDRKESR